MGMSKETKSTIKSKAIEYGTMLAKKYLPILIDKIKKGMEKRNLRKRDEYYVEICELIGHQVNEDFIKKFNGTNRLMKKAVRRWNKYNNRITK